MGKEWGLWPAGLGSEALEYTQASVQAVSTTPFPATIRPVTTQLSAAQAVVPQSKVPVVHDAWLPEMVYPLSHMRAHKASQNDFAASAQAVSKAEFRKTGQARYAATVSSARLLS